MSFLKYTLISTRVDSDKYISKSSSAKRTLSSMISISSCVTPTERVNVEQWRHRERYITIYIRIEYNPHVLISDVFIPKRYSLWRALIVSLLSWNIMWEPNISLHSLYLSNKQITSHESFYLVARTVVLMIPTATVCLISRTAKRPRGG